MKPARRTILAAATAASYSRILGANDRIALGFIGVGERGMYVEKRLTTEAMETAAIANSPARRTS